MIGASSIAVNDGSLPPDMAVQLRRAWFLVHPGEARTAWHHDHLPAVVRRIDGWPFDPADTRARQLAAALAALFSGPAIIGAGDRAYEVYEQLAPHIRRPEDGGGWLHLLEAAFVETAVGCYRKAVSGEAATGSGDALVTGLVRSREPMVIGGAEKTMKTCLAIDLAAAVATGTPFLGREVNGGEMENEPARVWALTLETPPRLWAERFERAVRARGGDVVEARKRLTVTGRADALQTGHGRRELSAFIENADIGLAIIDPLYQILPPVSSADLVAQGTALRKLVRPIVKAGAAPVLVHHFTKSAAAGAVPSLHDLAGSAVGPFARSWLLLSRSRPYQGDGVHHLAALIGSSCGTFETAAVAFDEWKWSLGRDAARRAGKARSAAKKGG